MADAFALAVGAGIRRERRLRGLTQESLAALADVSRNHVARLERGEQVPSLLTAKRIGDALMVSVDRLLA